MILLHNPRCSKSREALAALEARGFTPTIRRYLDEPLSKAEIVELLAQLKLAPLELVRQKEELWREVSAGCALNDAEIVELLVQHPKLIERPILIYQNQAAIGRPVENLLNLLSK
ncbi:arsenate reductase (glutaredoxin) [Deefgea rivuli]|uniref:arsenate reductase (glutaredoxin) n=1 Tax=Deefgea rivuli TaxID=400948 RepID=UPI00048A16B9|nr:arsenate reductase (glutaredoxin) [Deefgea rivuli]